MTSTPLDTLCGIRSRVEDVRADVACLAADCKREWDDNEYSATLRQWALKTFREAERHLESIEAIRRNS